MSSRPQSTRTVAPPRQRQLPPLTLSCGHCKNPIKEEGALYIVACNCLMCMGCAEPHFQANDFCLVCKRQGLQESDLVIVSGRQPIRPARNTSTVVEELLTRNVHPQRPEIGFDQLCARIVQGQENQKVETKFVLKQLLREAKIWRERCHRLRRECQDASQNRKQLQVTLAAREEELRQSQAKILEQNDMIMKFRREHMARRSGSSQYSRDGQNEYGGAVSRGIPLQSAPNHGIMPSTGHPTTQVTARRPHSGQDDYGCYSSLGESPRQSGMGGRMSSSQSHHTVHINKRRRSHAPPTTQPRHYPGRSPTESWTR